MKIKKTLRSSSSFLDAQRVIKKHVDINKLNKKGLIGQLVLVALALIGAFFLLKYFKIL